MIESYPKIHALDKAKYISELFVDPIEITEKLDGSQFRFGVIGKGLDLICCTKGSVLDLDTKDKLFKPAIETCKALHKKGLIHIDLTYFAETLHKPKHNTLTYDNVPKGNIALFAVYNKKTNRWLPYSEIKQEAIILDIDVVELLFRGVVPNEEVLEWTKWYDTLLEKKSQLGGSTIEGFVIKNLHRETTLGGVLLPFIQAKFVSEAFKEKHGTTYKFKSSPSGWHTFKKRYRTEARWNKSIQHLRDEGKLLDSPADIGKLITAIKDDIEDECKDEIVKYLWNHFGKDLLREACHGFSYYYKEYLLKEDK